ncbi:hypothetical protein [Aminobacter sp. MET-1]|uniref:hypothetical protein n=1 Tax=Aminobacter sp. MET-1 TaxID=2951085 RepID=UPI002269FD2E|nr:hypothetical protein [Aminobacter sp. MET-1]MCX8572055.1 hypothetical protein [Aminobacter sp. MET-1]
MMKVLLPFFLAAGMFCGLAIAQETLPQTIPPDLASPQLDPDKVYSDVIVIPFETLNPPVKQEVETIVNETAAGDLKKMQGIIGETRQAVITLASIGLDPSQVVAAGVTEDGVLTLVVQQMA